MTLLKFLTCDMAHFMGWEIACLKYSIIVSKSWVTIVWVKGTIKFKNKLGATSIGVKSNTKHLFCQVSQYLSTCTITTKKIEKVIQAPCSDEGLLILL